MGRSWTTVRWRRGGCIGCGESDDRVLLLLTACWRSLGGGDRTAWRCFASNRCHHDSAIDLPSRYDLHWWLFRDGADRYNAGPGTADACATSSGVAECTGY